MVIALSCSLTAARDATFKSFTSQDHEYRLMYPSNWYSQTSMDMFSIVNFFPSRAIRGTGLAEGGAGIRVLTASQATKRGQRLPANLDDFVLTQTPTGATKTSLKISDGLRTLDVIETKSSCCDPTQDSLNWYFDIGGHLFVGTAYYWQADPNAVRYVETFKRLILSIEVSPESHPR
jgi:hypothetical protein